MEINGLINVEQRRKLKRYTGFDRSLNHEIQRGTTNGQEAQLKDQ